MHYHDHEKAKSGFGGFIAGALMALGVTYLIRNKMTRGQKLRAKGWMLKMKGDILDKIDNTKDMSADAYDEVVDTVAEKYEDLKNVDKEDLQHFAEKLKRKWRWIQRFKEE